MTSLPAPQPPIQLATAEPGLVNTLLALHHADALALPPAFLNRVRSADTLQRAARILGEQIARHDPSALRRAELDGLKAAAAAGRLPDDAAAGAIERQRTLEASKARYADLADAASETDSELTAAIRNGADQLGELLLGALSRVLEAAAEPAQVMLDAGPFNWGDPASLYAAPAPVQSAFAALVPLATLHDRLRGATVELAGFAPAWQGIADPAEAHAARQRSAVPGADPEWRRAGRFAGYGVELSTGGYSQDARWRFAPVGHAVERLIAAATDPALEPIAEAVSG